MAIFHTVKCDLCGNQHQKSTGDINAAKKHKRKMFCSRKCARNSRKTKKTDKEKRALKKQYDAEYRRKNAEIIKSKKADYHKRTYNPEAARQERKKRSKWHLEYCRRYYADPKNKAHKVDYDRRRRAKIKFGEYWESQYLLLKIDDEIKKHANRRECLYQWGRANKAIERKRELCRKMKKTYQQKI